MIGSALQLHNVPDPTTASVISCIVIVVTEYIGVHGDAYRQIIRQSNFLGSNKHF